MVESNYQMSASKKAVKDAARQEISAPAPLVEPEDAGEDGEESGGDCRSAVKERCYGNRIPARVVLGIVSFFGFCTNYMLRVNLNIAIVAMVKGGGRGSASDSGFSNFTSEEAALSSDDEICFRSVNYDRNETRNSTFEFINSINVQDEEDTFAWNSAEQGVILGAFYWSYVSSVVPGAMLARRIGPKLMFGGANGIAALLTLMTPFAARTSFSFLIALRLLEGLVSGTTWPAMHTMASRWIPPHERSKFITAYLGNSVGIAVTYPLCGLLIDYYGWAAAFYVPACITLVWCFFWWLLAFESPNSHPRITREEKEYIENAVSSSLNRAKMAVPWLEIAKSGPFWAVVIANFGSLWGFMTSLAYSPTYFKNVHGFNIQANGMLSGLPNIIRFISAVIISYVADRFIQEKVLSFTLIRKVTTLIAVMLPGLLYLLMTNVGCDAPAEIAILTTAAAMNGATSSGPLANTMDLAPNFAGMMIGLVNLISMCTGFIVPSVVGAIIINNKSRGSWRVVFIICGIISILCSLIYLCLGSAEVQPWNGGTSENQKESYENEHCQALRIDDPNLKNGSTLFGRINKKRDKSNERVVSKNITEKNT